MVASRALGYLYAALAVAFWVVFALGGRSVDLVLAIVWTVVAVGWIAVALRAPMPDVAPGASIGRRLLSYFGLTRSGTRVD
jgi:hypothetical protein